MVNPPPVNHAAEYAGDDDEIGLLDLLRGIAENLRLLIIGPIVTGLITLAYTYTLNPTFTAKTTIIPPAQQNTSGGAAALLGQLGGLGAIAGGAAGIGAPIDQYIAFFESNTVLDHLIEQFQLMERFKVKNHNQARQILKGSSKITADKKSNLIVIEVSNSDPQFAANLANAYVSALSQMLGKMALGDAKSRRDFLEKQINEATEKSYRSPIVREAIIQTVVREYESAVMDQKKSQPYIQQIDTAEAPELKSGPKRALIAVIATISAFLFLLIFVFVRDFFRNAIKHPETNIRIQSISNALQKQFKF